MSRSISAAGQFTPDDAVIAPAVTVHIDAIGKTLHEPHLRFIGGAVHDDTGVQGFDS